MVTIERVKGGKWYTATERLYLDANNNVVTGKGANRVSLLVAEGAEIPWHVAEKYGLTTPKPSEPSTKAGPEEPKAEETEVSKPKKSKR
jgi:hypothetical protein